ncbi:MAG: nucleotide exchange factor GrpE [Lachnospiraceae bacterium]|nr:nucleotide exchange factor GrpE [Lachnospiraceae bacterium]
MGKKKNKGKNKMEEVLNEEVLNKEDEASEADGTNEEAKDAVEETAETEASVETEEEAGEDATEESDPKQSRIEELEDKVKRQLAEFDNFRKRTDKEKETMFEAGAKSVIEKILPVVDNFERGLASIPEEEQGSAHAEGMMMIYKQLMGELEKLDVKPIEAVGKEFNPELHNAVMQCESDEYESGIVAQELQKGYTYRDSVIRHSMVAVVS